MSHHVLTVLGTDPYEVFTVADQDMQKLPEIIKHDIRNIVFLCITNIQDIPRLFEYAELLQKVEGTHTQIGAFAYSAMDAEAKQKFLLNQITITSFADLKNNSLVVIRQILEIFEAKGSRKYVKVKARGITQAFISIKASGEPVKGQVIELSAFACAILINEMYHSHFKPGMFISEVLLALKGIRIRLAARLLGFSKTNKDIYLFRYYGLEIKEGKMSYTETLSRDIRQKFHKYINSCLREEFKSKLAAIQS